MRSGTSAASHYKQAGNTVPKGSDKFRKNVRETVWKNAEEASPDGVVRDPMLEKPMRFEDPWDMGRQPGYEHWKHARSAEERGIGRKQFLDEFNDVEHYRLEIPLLTKGIGVNLKLTITSDIK